MQCIYHTYGDAYRNTMPLILSLPQSTQALHYLGIDADEYDMQTLRNSLCIDDNGMVLYEGQLVVLLLCDELLCRGRIEVTVVNDNLLRSNITL